MLLTPRTRSVALPRPGCSVAAETRLVQSSQELPFFQCLRRPLNLRLLHLLPQPQVAVVPRRTDRALLDGGADGAAGFDAVGAVAESARRDESTELAEAFVEVL